jgi:drug/metabolite transporter (DMT)-like permease
MLGYVSRQAADLGMGTFPYVAWRGAIATLAMLPFVFVMSRRFSPRTGQRLAANRRRALIVAALLGAVVNIATFAAFTRTSIAIVLICFYTFPAIVSIAAVPLYGERIDRFRATALLVSGAGLVTVLLAPLFTSSTSTLQLDPIGVGLALLAAVSQASFILIAGRGFRPLRPWSVGIVLIFAAGACAALLAVATFDFAGLSGPFADTRTWIWILFGAIAGGAIPTTLFMIGIGWIGPSRAAILMTVEPVVGVIIAGLLLGEQPSPVQLVGGAMVVAAAAALQVFPPRKVEPEPEFGPLV